MALSHTQVHQLRAKLEARHVKTRKANGADLYYVEGWHVIAEANRIFGYDAWDRRTLANRCVWSGAGGAYHEAAYTAKGAHQSVLHKIFGICIVTRQRAGDAQQHLDLRQHVPFEQLLLRLRRCHRVGNPAPRPRHSPGSIHRGTGLPQS